MHGWLLETCLPSGCVVLAELVRKAKELKLFCFDRRAPGSNADRLGGTVEQLGERPGVNHHPLSVHRNIH